MDLRPLPGHLAERHIRRPRGQYPCGRAGTDVSGPPEGLTLEDDELLGGPGHRDVSVDRSFDALAECLWVDEDD